MNIIGLHCLLCFCIGDNHSQRHYAFRLCVNMAARLIFVNLSGSPWGSFFKFWHLNIHWDASRMHWLEIGGQRSKVTGGVTVSLGPQLKNSQANYVYISHTGVMGHKWCSDYRSKASLSLYNIMQKHFFWLLFNIVAHKTFGEMVTKVTFMSGACRESVFEILVTTLGFVKICFIGQACEEYTRVWLRFVCLNEHAK